ncbi:tRNA lysidine(34) synthetase TilS [Uliginosibacterium sp. 31-12]|uniref:tRNA lysidine(34) synthetase TilS n=1 Tax=Uliginosibacterium sp. 31-12 TaxID=3062781 RepID=UPI0026E416AA|nr:tRNA lysidine(34) synthetase TilS [Uliginosibacterium sp. 31-12]MDO6387936.1 tRNA lysidine(34) synthetase TilS [Uliginosibacterium sp. 31-12]
MPSPDLASRLLPVLRACAGTRLCVAYSGGLDSTVLLHLLARLAPEAGFVLSALHVHHGLSLRADDWVKHCEAECDALGLPLRVERVVVTLDAGRGLEAAAREVRHAAFASVEADWVVLAHHADDQAETLLHRLVRGAGVAGVAGMRERDPARRLWRPLLAEPRAVLLEWAQAEGLRWIEDDSNADSRFMRNYLRHSVLPALKARQPAVERSLARAAAHFAEAEDLLGELAVLDAGVVRLGLPGSRSGLRALSPARGRNLLRYWLRERGEQAPDAARLASGLRALRGEAPVRECFGDLALCAYRERIWTESARLMFPAPQPWVGEAEMPWAEGGVRFLPISGVGLRLDPGSQSLLLRSRCGGERLRLAENRPTRSFKVLCQEADLPVWWRETLPLLCCGDQVLWIGGVGAAAGFSALPGEVGWRIEWRGPDGLWRG